ncbi:MAG: beta-N-acetylhexosaminidase [Candidatus Bathyarchaeia archaeon]
MWELLISIVPEPKILEFKGNWFTFNGFENFPEFLAQEFKVPRGNWSIGFKPAREGTGIQVRDRGIELWGDEGICYASILQLIMQGRGRLPEVTILEDLRFRFRGFHLDIARGGVPRVETFKRILRWLFILKYNYLAIYLEDLFPWRRYPQIGGLRGRLQEEELREVIEYGEKLGVEVLPSLELSGHMENILTLPEFKAYSEWHNPREGCLALGDPEAREFAYSLLEEALEFFPSRYIHLGGDETWALGRGRSLNRTWRFEGPRLYEEHHSRMIKMAIAKGKKPILWGDMITGMHLRGEEEEVWAGLMESPIWREALIANWDYTPAHKQHFRKRIGMLKDRGIQQIACPGLSNWNRYYPNYQTALENLKSFLEAAREEGLQGFLITAWGDDGEECLFSLLEPLMLAAIEFAEGGGKWEEKWLALSGEGEEALRARTLLGSPQVSDMLKHVVFRDSIYHRLSSQEKEEIRKVWEEVLRGVESTPLPEDLSFIRRMLEVGVRILRGEATASDYLTLSNLYSQLWLKERKPEGLGRIIERFWGAAGREDLHLP